MSASSVWPDVVSLIDQSSTIPTVVPISWTHDPWTMIMPHIISPTGAIGISEDVDRRGEGRDRCTYRVRRRFAGGRKTKERKDENKSDTH